MTQDIGKRERNKIEQKLRIVHGFLDAMRTASIHDIRVEDVCDTIGISKVTFFNYFHSKEGVIEYYTHLWGYETVFDLKQKDIRGVDAIYAIFEKMADHPAAVSVLQALAQFVLKHNPYQYQNISDNELRLFHPKAFDAGARVTPLRQMFATHLQLVYSKDTTVSVLVQQLMIVFFGVPLLIATNPKTSLKQQYLQSLDLLFERMESR